MSTWATRWIKLRDREADLARLRQNLSDASEIAVDAGSDFAVIAIASPSLQPDDLSALSKEFGEAMSVQGQTVADLLVYDHFKDGARTRGLTFAGEAGWVRVLGEPQAWEQAFFFAPARLDELVSELEDEIDDAPTLARDTAELRRLWSKGRLEEGSKSPRIQATSLARALAKHHGFAAPSMPRLSTAKQRAVK